MDWCGACIFPGRSTGLRMRLTSITLLLIAAMLVPAAWAGTIEGEVHPAGPNVDRSSFVISVEDIEEPAVQATAVMDQKNLMFNPHELAVQRGTTVQFPNSDPLKHNVFSISPAKRFNLGMYAQGESRSVTFDQVGVVEILCNVHLEMSAYVVVLPNHYFAQTSADGKFRITGVPPGKHRVRCWQESTPEEVKEIEVPAEGAVDIQFWPGSQGHGGPKHG